MKDEKLKAKLTRSAGILAALLVFQHSLQMKTQKKTVYQLARSGTFAGVRFGQRMAPGDMVWR